MPRTIRHHAVRRVAGPLGLAVALAGIAGTGAAAVATGTVSAHHRAAAAAHPPRPVVTASPVPRRSADAVSRGSVRVADVTPVVAPLRSLQTPDVLLKLPAAVTPAQQAALAHVAGVTGTAVLDVADLHTKLAGTRRAVGVDPSEVRGFTPRLTAASDPLWQSVARGDMALSFTQAGALRGQLGHDVLVAAARPGYVRVGALASIGLPDVDAVVSHAQAHQLGFAERRWVLVAAPRLTLTQIGALAHQVFGSGVTVDRLRPEAVDQSVISPYALARIPAAYLRLYRAAAATCPGLPWTVLAAIGAVETGHGADTAVSSAGARGPMQFLPATFRAYGVDGDGDGIANIDDPADAVYSAAHYLCMDGAGRGGQSLYDAIFSYNHADWYVREVAALALRYQNG